MKILAIETSCDETGIAVVEGEKNGDSFSFRVRKAALLSQALLHSPYGGVYPNLAKREHQKNLPVLFEQFKNEEYDAIAVTAGPGLEPALWTGITFAETLAKETGKPLYPINHMEGHFISSLAQNGSIENVALPVLGLLISGGHTEFILMKDWFEYELIGATLDDAVGEAFDKVARTLGLPYPGGPQISKLASEHRLQEESFRKGSRVSPLDDNLPVGKAGPDRFLQDSPFRLPRPMISENTCDVSFSGLKTAVLYAVRGKNLSEEDKKMVAHEFEDAVADVLISKTKRALRETGAKTMVIGGGVAANAHLREVIPAAVKKEFFDVEFLLPDPSITGDNAVMIAEAALARALSGKIAPATEPIVARGNLSLSA
jgi:N6-L-threonylcarbamoyladenine synthase